MNFRLFLLILRDTGQAWSRHRIPKMGAALAYYTAFSLAPLIVLILSLASLAVKKDFARHAILTQLNNLVGDKGQDAFRDILDHVSSPASLSWQTITSFFILVISATGAFGELQDSLNQIWEVPAQKHPIRNLIRGRVLSFAMIFVLGFFMLVSLVLSAFLTGVSRVMATQFPVVGLELTNTIVSTLVIGGLFGVIFRLLPAVQVTWRDIWPGALLSSALFSLGKFLLGWYLGRGTFSLSYGAAGSFLVILVWVFYSAQILFIGAEFTRSYSLRVGSLSGKVPSKRARMGPDGVTL